MISETYRRLLHQYAKDDKSYHELIALFEQNAQEQTQIQLRNQEAHYQQLVENSLDAISLHTPDGKYIYANPVQAQLIGYSSEELLNLPVEALPTLVHPDDLARVQEDAHQAAIQGKTVTKIQYRLKHKDGHYIWVENFAVPLFNETGELEKILSTTRDITENKETEKALQTHIERSNALLEAVPDLMFRFDCEGNYLDFQANYEDLYIPPEQLLNNTLHNTLPEHIAEQAMTHIHIALETGEMQTYEYELQIPVQGLRSYEVRMLPSGENEVTAIVRDITALKAIQYAYKKSEERSRKLIEAIPDLIFRISVDGVYLDYQANETDLYYQGSNLIGKTIMETVPPEFAHQAMQHIKEAISTGKMQTYEYQLPVEGRGVLDYEARIVPIDDQEIISYVRDITVNKRNRQRELELILEKERRKLLTDFIRNAAHEFRTPLTSINASAHIMMQIEEKQRRYQRAKQIEQQVQSLTHLLDMLLLMMRLNNTDILPKTRINVQDLYDLLCQDMQLRNGNRHHIKHTIEPGLPSITGNYDLLYEAIMQIFDNAHRFTPDSGTITMNVKKQDNHILFEIHDTGVGIADEAREVIFQTFWRKDDVHTTPGFGLGLPIVKEVVKLHGGKIEIDSEINTGTTVKLFLPITHSK